MLQWKEEYEVGVVEIDEQHQKLIDIANRVYELMRNELALDKYDQIVAIMTELRDYTKTHFAHEEEYMMGKGYQHRWSQKVQHLNFIKKLDEADFRQIDESQHQALLDVLDFLAKWLQGHIKGMDRRIGGAEK